MAQVITDLDNMISGGTLAGISSINTMIMDTVKPKAEAMNQAVEKYLELNEEIYKNKNCSF